MTLADMTREYIRQFAGSTMFGRGERYYRGGNESNLEGVPAYARTLSQVGHFFIDEHI